MAFAIVEAATQKGPATKPVKKNNPTIVVSARLGGFKGGKRKEEVLTKEQLLKIASIAGQARWAKHNCNSSKI